ncbi:APC family permease [Streptomyces fuscichromogenes]|uniref:APC family permease n=1 Tax=Streptomyces fuscichromogenes TaxID=1324013 RepID=UPI00382ADED6
MNTTEHLKREFRARDAFVIAFVFISPIVALYGVFGLVLQAAGPAGWWAFAIVLILQLLLAATLGVLVSRWPFEGGSYQWARRLVGPAYGWATGWIYVWTLIIVVASGAFFLAGFLPSLLGIAPFSVGEQTVVALAVLAFITVLNVLGPAALKIFTRFSLACEAIGSVGLATVLLIWHREQPLSVLTTTGGASSGHYLWGGFIVAIGMVGYSFAGFESVCSMAEEIKNPEKHLPKVMIGAVMAIGVVVLYSSLALILAIPDLPAVLAGQVADPAADTIVAALGEGFAKPFLALVVLGFLASILAAQTSVSRVAWSFARDGSLPGSGSLSKLSGRHGTPARAIVTIGVAAGVVTVLAFSDRVYATLVSAATTGFFITMSLVAAGLITRMARGTWRDGPFTFGTLTPLVAVVAGAWAAFQVINIAWPRATGEPWYVTWAVVVGVAAIAVLGVVARFFLPKHTAGQSEPESILIAD